ncbi:homer protein homolog 2-like, partial [Mustelus asterias]
PAAAKKWEQELQTLGENNARLSLALQESTNNVEHWKKQLLDCKEEGDELRQKIADLEAQCADFNEERERNALLSRTVKQLEADINEKEQELERLKEETQVIPQLMEQCEGLQQRLQAAEDTNKELEDKAKSLKANIEESRHKQGNLKKELTSFLEVLDGKIDELHGFRQGLAKLGMDN